MHTIWEARDWYLYLNHSYVCPASNALSKLQLTLSFNELRVECPDLKTQVVDSRTLDMHCLSEDDINTVTLVGEAVAKLCSVYVSGGNVGSDLINFY